MRGEEEVALTYRGKTHQLVGKKPGQGYELCGHAPPRMKNPHRPGGENPGRLAASVGRRSVVLGSSYWR